MIVDGTATFTVKDMRQNEKDISEANKEIESAKADIEAAEAKISDLYSFADSVEINGIFSPGWICPKQQM